LEQVLKIVVYLCSLVITIACIALGIELGLHTFLPDVYRGYLTETDDGAAKWPIGPFEPAQPVSGFNSPVPQKKPDNTIRIVSLGTSGTEGWLSAATVFNKYGLEYEPKSLSSYSRAIEFTMNEIADPNSRKIEVINLGVAAYNITDVIRMLKDSLKFEPDLLIIQIGGNETWTAERAQWSTVIDTDIPYFYSELGYELLTGLQASWQTLIRGDNAFNPLALFASKPQPVVIEPPGRAAGLIPRLATYKAELQRLGSFLRRKQIPALFLIPSQNIADYLPFGSMAQIGTTDSEIEKLNELLIEALALPAADDARDKYLGILALDDGIAEANFQLGKIYLQDNDPDKAREHFWKANDRDLVLKRLPGEFHNISRQFVVQNSYPYIDEMKFFEAKSQTGIVGFNWLDDDVHPNRQAQFDLGAEIVKKIVNDQLLGDTGYSANLREMPTFEDYNHWTGFDEESVGHLAYLKGAHNFITFGRYRQRMQWDLNPGNFLDPVIANLDIANKYAPNDQSRYLSAGLNLFLRRQENVSSIFASMNCRASAERGAQVHAGMMGASQSIFGYQALELKTELEGLLAAEGCIQ
jgi:lysophospholipase L1-like esterase